MYPSIAATASLIEHFGMPIRELEEKFTLSELTITAWRSQEIAAKFEIELNEDDKTTKKRPKTKKKFVNKEGELDLSLATGPEAVQAFRSIGLVFPVIKK